MDEICFRLTNRLEVLQVEGSVALQQGQQWITIWLTQIQQLLKNVWSEEYVMQMRDIGYNIRDAVLKALEQMQLQCYSVQFNSRILLRQMSNVCLNDVSRREVGFCLAGLGIGGIVGYTIGLHWRQTARGVPYMKAILCHRYIGIEGVSTVDDAEVPTIRRSNELLIQVKASSVNVVDAKICHGYSKVYRRLLNRGQQTDLPIILGRDCAGIVTEIGQSVLGFDIGDEVFLAVPSWAPGTMAEYIVVTDNQVARRPKLITFEASACLPYSGCLAWDAIVNKSIIEEGNAKGKRVLVYGGCSPIGCIVIQLIKLWGGHITAVCKLKATRVVIALGADDIIVAQDDSSVQKDLDLHDKYDAIFYTEGNLSNDDILKKYLLPHGSLVSTMPEFLISDSLGFVLRNIFAVCVRMKLLFQYIFGRNGYQWKDGKITTSTYLEVLRELVDADQLQIVVGAAFRPNQIEHALTHVMSDEAMGGTIIKFK